MVGRAQQDDGWAAAPAEGEQRTEVSVGSEDDRAFTVRVSEETSSESVPSPTWST
jgi:hypothetical protein